MLCRTSIAVMMCGVQSPSMGRRAPPPGAEAPADGAPSASNGSAAASEKAAPTSAAAAVGATPPASAPEPYAAQSKEFVEMAALNRCSIGLVPAGLLDREREEKGGKSLRKNHIRFACWVATWLKHAQRGA